MFHGERTLNTASTTWTFSADHGYSLLMVSLRPENFSEAVLHDISNRLKRVAASEDITV